MRARVLAFVLGGFAAWMSAGGCSASGSGGGGSPGGTGTGATGGSAASDSGTGGSGGVNLGGAGGSTGGGGGIPDAGCALFTDEAKQAPSAVLFVVDGSASMSQSQKWGTAQIAVITAIDKPAFDNTTLGLVRYPASFTDPPQCLCDYACAALGGCTASCKALAFPTGIACGVSFLPQVQLSDSGVQKSNQGGVRKQIYDYLANPANGPVNDPSDASPIYDAMVAGYTALGALAIDRRVLVLITDGGFSCTSLSNPKRPGYFDGACDDWEYPDSVNTLVKQKRDDTAKPTYTFIVGVPGSDSTGQNQGSYATAPYNMLLALSTYAVSGVPDALVPAGCDKTAVFSKTGAAPAVPCHFDLSKSGFNADQLAAAIDQIRGKALGCVFDLPAPPAGKTLDPSKVNVYLTLDGVTTQIPKRSNPSDTCAADLCWDYNAKNQVELIGKACDDLSKAKAAKVDIQVGCIQLIK